MKTNEEVKVLVAAINTGKVSDEQLVACKEVAAEAMMSVLAGGTPTSDQIVVNTFVARHMAKAVANAGKFVETEAKKAEAEAAYKKALQAHKVEVNNLLTEFVKTNFIGKTGKVEFTPVENRDSVKTLFDALIKALPALPKKPNASGSTRTSTSNDYSTPKPVVTIAEGSTNWHIKHILETAEAPLTKKEILVLLKVACVGKSETTLQITLGKALNGRLPILEIEAGKFVWNPEEEQAPAEKVEEPKVEEPKVEAPAAPAPETQKRNRK